MPRTTRPGTPSVSGHGGNALERLELVLAVAPGDLYQARMVAPYVDAMIHVHRATDRVVYQVVSHGVVRLGPHVDSYRERGCTVEAVASKAGR